MKKNTEQSSHSSSNLRLLCIFGVLVSLAYGQPATPNIVFIFADDMGWNDVGYHNGSDVHTPTLDFLARHGLRMTQHYVLKKCAPSRAALMTGRYDIHTGMTDIPVPGQAYSLPTKFATYMDVLSEHTDYQLYMVGKWHIGMHKWKHTPLRRGFDRFYGSFFGGQGKYDHVKCVAGTICGYDLRNGTEPVDLSDDTFLDFEFRDRVVEMLADHMVSQENAPFLMHHAPQIPHAPRESPQRFRDYYNSSNATVVITDSDRRGYAAMVSALDEIVEDIVYALQSLRYSGTNDTVWDHTLLVFTSDNGAIKSAGGNNWPLRGGKHNLFEGGVRVPCFVTGGYLDDANRGMSTDAMMHVTDWFPTFLSVAGLDAQAFVADLELDGYDFTGVLADPRAESPREDMVLSIVKDEELCETEYDGKLLCGAYRYQNWKVVIGAGAADTDSDLTGWNKLPNYDDIQSTPSVLCNYSMADRNWDAVTQGCPYNGDPCLFDLDADPCEYTDVKDAYPFVFEDMMDRMMALRGETVRSLESKHYYDYEFHCAHPSHWDGFWTPWGKCNTKKVFKLYWEIIIGVSVLILLCCLCPLLCKTGRRYFVVFWCCHWVHTLADKCEKDTKKESEDSFEVGP